MIRIPEQCEAFDRKGCLDRLDNDEELAGQIVQLFLDDFPARLKEIQVTDSFTELYQQFHCLKSSSGSAGASKIQNLAISGESLCDAEKRDDVNRLKQELSVAFNEYSELVVA